MLFAAYVKELRKTDACRAENVNQVAAQMVVADAVNQLASRVMVDLNDSIKINAEISNANYGLSSGMKIDIQ